MTAAEALDVIYEMNMDDRNAAAAYVVGFMSVRHPDEFAEVVGSAIRVLNLSVRGVTA